jgi:hypothetical protein
MSFHFPLLRAAALPPSLIVSRSRNSANTAQLCAIRSRACVITCYSLPLKRERSSVQANTACVRVILLYCCLRPSLSPLTLQCPVVTTCTTRFNPLHLYVLPTQCIYVFCVDLRTNSDYFTVQHQLTGFYNSDGVCLLRGTFCPHSEFVCFVWIWEQTEISSLYSINWLDYITEMECVYCAVRSAHTVYLCVLCGSDNKQRLFNCTH